MSDTPGGSLKPGPCAERFSKSSLPSAGLRPLLRFAGGGGWVAVLRQQLAKHLARG